MNDQERREDCRHEVRRYLADRSSLAFRADTIQHYLDREWKFTIAEVRDALAFLVSAKQAEIEPEPCGATEYFKITATGTLAHERGR
jgi:hypothetical protein